MHLDVMFLKSHTKSDIHIFAYYARALSFLLLFLSLSYSIVADFMVIILLSKMYISLVILCQSCLEVCRKSFTPCIFFFFYLVFDDDDDVDKLAVVGVNLVSNIIG